MTDRTIFIGVSVAHCEFGFGTSSDIDADTYEPIVVSMMGTPEVVAEWKAGRVEREAAAAMANEMCRKVVADIDAGVK